MDRIHIQKAMDIIMKTGYEPEALDRFVFLSESHAGQYDFLNNAVQKENVLHAGNGWGKTEMIARRHIISVLRHFGVEGWDTMNLSITFEQAREVIDRIYRMCMSSPVLSWMIKDVSRVRDVVSEIYWVNGNKTVSKTTKRKGEAIEGKEFGYVSCDDIAMERHLEFIRDVILLPRLRKWDDTQLDFYATPKGMNAYYRVVQDVKRKGGYVRSGSSYENTFISREHWDYVCEGKSQLYIDQVVEGRFIDNSNFMFASRLDDLFDYDLVFEGPKTGCVYIDGWDLARGRKGDVADSTTKYTLKAPDHEDGSYNVVDRWVGQLPWTDKSAVNETSRTGVRYDSSIEREIRLSHARYNDSSVYVDSTGVGDTLFEIVSDIAVGVDFRGKKQSLLEHVQLCIDSGKIKSPYIQELADQLTVYTLSDLQLNTDDIMGLTVACAGIKLSSVDNSICSESFTSRHITPHAATIKERFGSGTDEQFCRSLKYQGSARNPFRL